MHYNIVVNPSCRDQSEPVLVRYGIVVNPSCCDQSGPVLVHYGIVVNPCRDKSEPVWSLRCGGALVACRQRPPLFFVSGFPLNKK